MITDATLSSVESEVLQKAEVLAFFLRSVTHENPSAGKRLLQTIVERLNEAAGSEKTPLSAAGEQLVSQRPVLVSPRPYARDEIEEFILDNLKTSAVGLSVQELVDRFDEARLGIKRQTLVVRLHRMVQSGKLVVRAHGHYALSEVETRRQQIA